MKRNKLRVSDFKRMYDVLKRQVTLYICGFVVGANLVAAAPILSVDIPNDFSPQKTEVTSSDLIHVKEEVNSEILEKEISRQVSSWHEAIDEVCVWPDNWDEEGAVAVKPGVGDTAKMIVSETAGYVGLLDNVYPTAFGSICLEWGRRNFWVNAEVSSNSINFYHGDGGSSPIFSQGRTLVDSEVLALLREQLGLLWVVLNG